MAKALCALFCVGMVVILLPLGVTARLCCDPECNRKTFRVIIMSLCSDRRLLLVPISYHTVYFYKTPYMPMIKEYGFTSDYMGSS